MTTLAIVGAQWGDEGKGKVVDVVAARADVVARFAGGNNAGHTLVVDGEQIVTHLVPSGCLYRNTLCVLGAGMVVDPEVLREEVARLRGYGLLQGDVLRISGRAHVIFPFYRALDGLREDRAPSEDGRIGTTRRGIGPAYEAKAARRGIRICDLLDEGRLRERLFACKAALDPEFERLGGKEHALDVDRLCEQGSGWGKWLQPWICDASRVCNDAIDSGKRVLIEGAQGALLDVDHGTYPYVTSSSAVAGGACTGLGIGPTKIDAVWGITKAYATRVGSGPFPTKLAGSQAERVRHVGHEYGATTGRPRDCGWLDLPALTYAARVNGLTGLCVTKLDVLARLPEAKLCVSYADGLDPGVDDLDGAEPVYKTVIDAPDPALLGALRKARTLAELPTIFRQLLDEIEETVGVPVVLVSCGPDRSETILVGEPFG